MPPIEINLIDNLVGAVIGAVLTGLIGFGRYLWTRQHPLVIEPKKHQANSSEWDSKHSLILKNRSSKTCHSVWIVITTDNQDYDLTKLRVNEASTYPPYGQVFPLKNISVSADFSQVLRRDRDGKVFKIIRIAMILPGDRRLFNVEATGTRKGQTLSYEVVDWSSEPVQILTKEGTVALKYSLPPGIGHKDETYKLLAQGVVAKKDEVKPK